ncbi:hypothetical protein B7L68_08225 [Thermoproteus sp. CP80]|nr:hypothetical protein B7L68_08225 [Thermoproteus sp. CP80]
MAIEAIEKPLPKPTDATYVEARLLEALVEARLAFPLLEEELTRNAAGAPSLSARRRRLEAGGLSIGATGLLACMKAAGSRGGRTRRIPPTPWRRRRRPRRALGF